VVLTAIESEPVSVQFLAGELPRFDYLLDFLVSQAEQDVFGFEIGVYDPADAIEEVESHENLPCDFLDDVQRQSLVVVPLEHFEQVDS